MTISCDCPIIRNKEVRCSRPADSIQNYLFISTNNYQLITVVFNGFSRIQARITSIMKFNIAYVKMMLGFWGGAEVVLNF